MKIELTHLRGDVIINPFVYQDSRGFFTETYQVRRYVEHGLPGQFVQDNHSRSIRGTLRGLHLQLTPPQGKLIPKGTECDTVSTREIKRVQRELNDRPRVVLHWQKPTEVIHHLVALNV